MTVTISDVEVFSVAMPLTDTFTSGGVAKSTTHCIAVRLSASDGSQGVSSIAESLGLDAIFCEAGFEWRGAGCSMCLGMNPDKLVGDQLCASSSNRNFKGRQGSPTGRTILMSPVMVAAAAITGEVSDAREVFGIG